MKIIYEGEGGILTVKTATPEKLTSMTGTEEEKLIHLANKDLPTGTPYEITDVDLSDRTFRDAWEYISGDTEKISEDLSLLDQLKYNKITQEYYDANAD